MVFEVNDFKFPNTGECDSHCARIKRPKRDKFEIKVWDGNSLMDRFKFDLPDSSNVIRMTKDIFSSAGWWDPEKILDKIPPTVEINGEKYVLEANIEIYPLHYIYNTEPFTKKEKRKEKKKR